ncbi:MAG: MMPL family transporter [Rhodospirillales bacterium]|nr:MMPL family transporter [Rhodospirillales bacterium]
MRIATVWHPGSSQRRLRGLEGQVVAAADREPAKGRLARLFAAVSGELVRVACLAPAVTLAALLLLAGVSVWLAAATLRIDTSTENMLSPALPFRKAAAELRETFPGLGQTLAVVVKAPNEALADRAARTLSTWMSARPEIFADVFYPEGDPFLRQHGFLYLSPDALAGQIDRLASAQGLLGTLSGKPSLVGLSEVLLLALDAGQGDRLESLAPAMTRMARTAEAVAAGKPSLLSWRAVLAEREEVPGSGLRVVLTEPALDYGSLAPAKAAMQAVRAAARELDLAAGGVTVGFTGKPALHADELQSIRGNIAGIGLLSFFLVALLLWRGLGSGRMALAVGLLLILGLALTAGFAAVAVGRLNLLSIAFAVLFVGLSVDYAIHTLLRLEEYRARGAGLRQAAVRSAQVQAPALWLCALSSIVAFLAFLPTDYIGLAELGLISAGGIAIALLLCFTLLPAALILLRVPPLTLSFGRLAGRWERALTRHRLAVLSFAGFSALGSVFLLPGMSFDNDPLSLRDPASPSVRALGELLNDPRAAPYRAEALVSSLEEAEALADAFRDLPEVASAITLNSFVPGGQEEKLMQLGDASFLLAPLLYPAPPAPPPTQERRLAAVTELVAGLRTAPDAVLGPASGLAAALSRFLEMPDALPALETALLGDLPQELAALRAALTAGPVILEDLPDNLASRYLAPGGAALVVVRPERDLRDPYNRARFVEAVQGVWPGATGEAVTIVAAGQAVIGAFAEASIIAFVLVAVLVASVLRRVSYTAIALLPLVLAALYCGALAVLFGIAVNFANVIVLPLLFGLGIDSGLHLVARRREAPGAPLLDNATPRAVIVSAMTTLASFGALSFSDHPGTASMGLMLLLALASVLFAVFLVLPALIGRADSASERS